MKIIPIIATKALFRACGTVTTLRDQIIRKLQWLRSLAVIPLNIALENDQ